MRALSVQLALLLLGASLTCAAAPERILRVYDLLQEGHRYTAVVIEPMSATREVGYWGAHQSLSLQLLTEGQDPERYFDGPGFAKQRPKEHMRVGKDAEGEASELAESLLRQAEDWLVQFYEERGMFAHDADGRMREAFRKTESLVRGDSKFVFITETHDPASDGKLGPILAMSRIATIHAPHELFPMEARVEGTEAAGRVPRLEPELREQTELVWGLPAKNVLESGRDLIRDELPLVFQEVTNRWWYFDTVEFKNFARVQHVNLIDAMMKIAAAHGFTLNGGQKAPLGRPESKSLETHTPGGLVMWPGMDDSRNARIAQIVLETDGEKLRDLYAKRGFHVLRSFENPQMPASQTYWMGASIDEFNRDFVQGYAGDLHDAEGTSLRLRAGNTFQHLPHSCAYFYHKLAE